MWLTSHCSQTSNGVVESAPVAFVALTIGCVEFAGAPVLRVLAPVLRIPANVVGGVVVVAARRAAPVSLLKLNPGHGS